MVSAPSLAGRHPLQAILYLNGKPCKALRMGVPRRRQVWRMSVVQLGTWLMLVAGGLWAGGILIFAVEGTNLWARMSIEQYAVDFRRSLYRVDPLLPALGVISCAGTAVFALGSHGRA